LAYHIANTVRLWDYELAELVSWIRLQSIRNEDVYSGVCPTLTRQDGQGSHNELVDRLVVFQHLYQHDGNEHAKDAPDKHVLAPRIMVDEMRQASPASNSWLHVRLAFQLLALFLTVFAMHELHEFIPSAHSEDPES
jgi:hypothetical protein